MNEKREKIAEGIVTYTGEGAFFILDKLIGKLAIGLGPFAMFGVKILKAILRRLFKKKGLPALRQGKREVLYMLDIKDGEIAITEIDKALHEKNESDFVNTVFDTY